MGKSALLVIDMQRDFTDPQGLVFYPQNRDLLPRIAEAIRHCREGGLLIIFTQHRYRKGKKDRNLNEMRPCCIEGSGGEDLDPILPVDPEQDYIVPKRRYSAFFGTDLDLILRENGVENLIVAGTKTNCCIRATVTDAHSLGYSVIVPSDAVGTNSDIVNEVHLEDIRKYLGRVMSLEEIYKEIAAGRL
jgi:nicotinamidase-related amidase